MDETAMYFVLVGLINYRQKKKKMVIVKNKLIAKDQMMVAVR